MSNIVNYEVYVYDNNTWNLQARYSSEKRTEALEDAKSTEFSTNRPTKVIRETYDLNTQKFQQTLVYLSEYVKVSSTQRQPPMKVFPPLKIKEEAPKTTVFEALGRLFFVLAVSLAVAGLAATVFIKAIMEIGFLPTHITGGLIFMVFILLFLVISIPMSLKMVPWDVLVGSSPAVEHKQQEERNDKQDEKSQNLVETAKESQGTKNLANWLFRLWERIKGAPLPVADERREQEPSPSLKAAKTPEREEPAEEEAFTPPELKENAEEEKSPEAPPAPPPAEEEKIVIPAALEKEYLRLTTLLVVVLKHLQQNNTPLDTYARFGIGLFMFGATETLARHGKLTAVQNKTLLCGLLEVMGLSLPLAEMFCDKINEYSFEPSHLSVIQGGSKAMEVFKENPASSEVLQIIQKTMGKWLNTDGSDADRASSGIMTIMFTDMVGSTNFTQTFGDSMAQQLIRKHNTIVRQALSACNGREVKLTGDGTMASFTSASNAVDAAIAIQRAIAKYNKQTPTIPLEVRIGLNAGEPIIEENDLFGTTVQIAARICALADKDQIFVSNVVKELSAGKTYNFEPLGDKELKGIAEPQAVFEVVWNSVEQETVPEQTENGRNEQPVPKTAKKLSEALPEL